MIFQDILQVHNLIRLDEPETKLPAAQFILDYWKISRTVKTIADADFVLKYALQSLLDDNKYALAAVLCWGVGELFDPRPESVKRIWKGLRTESMLFVMGAGAMGKSYTVMAHDLLDFSRDPVNTTIKLVSTTAGHARANTFSTLVRFHRMSAVTLPGYIKQGFIGLDKDDRRSSISEVAVPAGQDGKGRLQGFHPLPRTEEHPVFGRMTRVRIRLDEAEDIPPGVFQGIDNVLLNKEEGNSIQVAGMFNPKRRDSLVASKVEPQHGWASFNIDRSLEWTSRDNWKVIRLDGARCENVIQKRIVFPGLLTYEGYEQLRSRGETSPNFMTFGRGAYPTESAAFNVIPSYMLDNARGTYIWGSTPVEIGTLDSAFEEGGDEAIFTAGKYGLAIAFQPEGKTLVRYDVPRHVIQLEQQFSIEKGNGILMAREVVRLCRLLRIRPEWFAMDRTGNATVMCDWLYLNFGGILGIQWGEKATDIPILEEDSEKASELYDDVVTEMMFAFGHWSEFGYIAFAPHMDTTKLFGQLSRRQYRRVSKTKMRIESKKDFKKNNSGESPDYSDSAIQAVHLVRMRDNQGNVAQMEPRPRDAVEDYMPTGDITSIDAETAIDNIDFVHSDS